jgi:muramidase (phage lysozyme)
MELQLNWIKNLPDLLWAGAEGRMVSPVYDGKYGVELIVHSDWADKHPLMVDFPMKFRDKIKFRYHSEFDGKTWILPQGAGPRIAAVVSHGDSLDACMEECADISAQIKGTQVECFTRSFPIIKEKMQTLAQWGITF